MTREEALKLIKTELCPIRCEGENNMDECEARWCEFKEAIKVIGQEPKTGRWIDREMYDADRWKCSECGRTEPYKENYCPNCGAKMQ